MVRSHAILALLGPDGSVRYVTPAVERVLGHAGEDLAGSVASHLVHPTDADRARRLLEDSLGGPGEPVEAELRVRHRDGSLRWLEVALVNLIDAPTVGAIV